VARPKSTKATKAKAKPKPRAPGRYTAPAPKQAPSSRLWVPATMFTMLGLGMIVIIANYLQLLPGGEAQNSYLFVGLGLFVGGAILSTQLR